MLMTIYIYIDFGKDSNDKGSKFQVDDHVKISKYKNIFAKMFFVIKKVKNTIPLAYVNDLNGEEIVGMFYQKDLQKASQEKFRNGDGDKLYVKWKGYDNSFISWIDEKDIVYI